MPAAELDFRAALLHPFAGLRPFEPHESFLFFGRNEHTRELLKRLGRHRMLAVVGTSGSGKSSLVRAGLLPALYSGHLAGAGTGWRIAVMRPGNSPLNELASALYASAPPSNSPTAVTEAELREIHGRTSMGLVDAVRRQGSTGENLLLVVDQFEELFRFRREREQEDGGAEASLFVASLLEAADQLELPIYIVLTMRSDFLGDCAQFPGLPEALNESQYLIPRLTREQSREAIEGALRIAGAGITRRLVERLLNDAGEDPDQLPILQHALSRTFEVWVREGRKSEIDLVHYETAGGIIDALNRHADSVYLNLASDADRQLCERIFRVLTTTEAGRAVRRAARLQRVLDVVNATDAAARERVRTIIRSFTDPGASFLIAGDPNLPDDTVIDISHESLIRKWQRLHAWAKSEAESAEWYRSLVNGARLHRSGDGGLWRNPELGRALSRRKIDQWNEAWGNQYAPGYSDVVEFLRESRDANRRRKLLVFGSLFLIVLAGIGGYWKYRVEISKLHDKLVAEEDNLAKTQTAVQDRNQQLEKARVDLALAKDPTQRLQLEKEIQTLNSQRQSLQGQVDAQRKQVQVTQNQVGYNDPAVQEASRQIADLRNQLAAVTKERDEAKQREHKPDEDAGKLQSDLETARGVIASLQRQLDEARAGRSTTVFPCSNPEVFFLAQNAIRTLKVENEDVFIASVTDTVVNVFMTSKQWWTSGTGRFANEKEALVSAYLKETKGPLDRDTFRQLSFGTQNIPLRSGWQLNVTARGAAAQGVTIRLCGERAASAK